MNLIDEELRRLRDRRDDLKRRVIPEFENKTQFLYSQIMSLSKESPDRPRIEGEYSVVSKELSIRSDEVIKIQQEMENLEQEKKFRR